MEITSDKLQEALAQIVNDLADTGLGYLLYPQKGAPVAKASLKHLCQYGVIGVSTVVHHPWSTTGSRPEWISTQDCFMIWLTPEGHEYLQGRIEVSKECTLENRPWTRYYQPVCKRHGRRHAEDEFSTKAKK